MRFFPAVFVAIAGCASYGPIVDLPLAWRGVEVTPEPSPAVSQALSAAPLAFGLRDARPERFVVGGYDDSDLVVRTSDNVAAYCSTRMGVMLAHAGARLVTAPTAVLEAELLEYRVIEGGSFNGVVRVRAIVHSSAGTAWSKTYTGKGKSWGRTHNPENFNEALSNALAEATQQLLQDDDFADALQAQAAAPAPPAPSGPPELPPADALPVPGPGAPGG